MRPAGGQGLALRVGLAVVLAVLALVVASAGAFSRFAGEVAAQQRASFEAMARVALDGRPGRAALVEAAGALWLTGRLGYLRLEAEDGAVLVELGGGRGQAGALALDTGGGLRLAYGLRDDPLVAPASRLFAVVAGAGLVVAVFLLWLAFTAGRRVTRGLAELVAEADEAAGLAPAGAATAIGLDAAFDTLADRLGALGRSLRDAQNHRREAEREASDLARARDVEHRRLSALLASIDLGVLMVEASGRVLYANPAFAGLWGLAAGAEAATLAALRTHLAAHLADPAPLLAGHDARDLHLAGGRILRQSWSPVAGSAGDALWLFHDVTDAIRSQHHLTYLAERDRLTGLYNRHRFEEELATAFGRAEREGGHLALLLFDLDGFKDLNDHFGHAAGDQALVRIAQALKSGLRGHELLARLGGDEFALLACNCDAAGAAALAERVVRTVGSLDLYAGGRTVRLTASVGLAMLDADSLDTGAFLRHADAALYAAKAAGKNTWRRYEAEVPPARPALDRLTWNERLGRALQAGAFEVHWQGVYRADGGLAYLEALIRLREGDALVAPGQFIAFAEKTGRIVEIDRWVLREVARALAAAPAHVRAAVNLSGNSVTQPDMADYIAGVLDAAGVAPARLIVEITETAAVLDLAHANRLVRSLRAMGIRVAIDDFGSGFASFAYLRQLGVDTVKIDGQFVRDLLTDEANHVFVRAMVTACRALGHEVVAEGVEQAASLGPLRELGVSAFQGYSLDRPCADHPALAA